MKHVRWALAAVALFARIGDTPAATVNANVHVQATLLIGCSVIGNTLDFGGVQVGDGGLPRTKTHVSVACPLGAAFQVGITDGAHPLSGQRRMKHGGTFDFLSYELYKSSSGNDRFGNAIISERVGGVGQGSLLYFPIPVWGEILAGQNLPAGDYSDDAIVTVYF